MHEMMTLELANQRHYTHDRNRTERRLEKI